MICIETRLKRFGQPCDAPQEGSTMVVAKFQGFSRLSLRRALPQNAPRHSAPRTLKRNGANVVPGPVSQKSGHQHRWVGVNKIKVLACRVFQVQKCRKLTVRSAFGGQMETRSHAEFFRVSVASSSSGSIAVEPSIPRRTMV